MAEEYIYVTPTLIRRKRGDKIELATVPACSEASEGSERVVGGTRRQVLFR